MSSISNYIRNNNNNNNSNNNNQISIVESIGIKIKNYSELNSTIKSIKNQSENISFKPTLKMLYNLCDSLVSSLRGQHTILSKYPIEPEDLEQYKKDNDNTERRIKKVCCELLKSSAKEVNIPLLTNVEGFKSCVDKIIEMDDDTATPETVNQLSNELGAHIENSKKRPDLTVEAKTKLDNASKKLSVFQKIALSVGIVVGGVLSLPVIVVAGVVSIPVLVGLAVTDNLD